MYVDEFEPLISQVNMMEISHSDIINHKLKARFMKELNADFKELNLNIYIYSHMMFILIVSLVLCQDIYICRNFQFSKIL